MSDVVVIGRQGIWWGVAVITMLLATGGVLLWSGHSIGISAWVGAGFLAIATIRQRATTARLEADALVVTTLRGSNRYPWAQLMGVSLSHSALFLLADVVVRPKGKPFDVPGPNAPQSVATIAIFGRTVYRRAHAQLRSAAISHGVLPGVELPDISSPTRH